MKKIVVVDLDECLCSINTFRYWLLFSFLFLFFSLSWVSLFTFNKCVLLRFAGKLDRVQMKRCVLMVTEQLPQYYIDWFCKFLQLFVNPDVLSEMRKYKGMPVVLCTAAPACYVGTFAEKFEFSQVFATSSTRVKNWKENIGQEKLASVVNHYGTDVVLECVITDHYDDLPLLIHAKSRLLVRPKGATLEALKDRFDFDVI